jgi:DNA-binding SARP family transcriptional activator/tetratricopeptide (TPR) repeat protein
VPVEFRLLGRIEVTHEGASVTPGRRQQRCLLGLLLLEANTTVPVERLADLLWDDDPPAGARATIHTYVSRLRAVLDPDGDGRRGLRLVRSGDGYQARAEADAVDALRLRSLVEQARTVEDPAGRARLLRDALGLWRGPPLAHDASERLRSRLEPAWQELRLAGLEAAIEAELASRPPAELVGELGSLLAEHPLRERFTGLLMLALYRAGRQAEALAAYQNTRRVLVDRLGAEPGPELQQLHHRILDGDTDLLATPPRDAPSVPVSAAAITPRQLPAAVRHFTGRQSELDTLTRLLDDATGAAGTVVISAIGGTAGVGKTALALRWAHQIADRFGDGQLFVNLRGFAPSGATPVTPAEAVRGFLDALGVAPERIPTGLDAQTALYRSLVAGKKILIVLDNARDEQQVRPLLPGAAGCLVVVTSRRRLTGLITAEGAAPLALDVLTEAEARDLLARRLGADRIQAEAAAVADIIALCARLPLALAVVAASAADHPHLDLAALAAQLRNSRDRLHALESGDEATNLRTVFSWSYHTLTHDAARLFRLLGLHPGPDISAPAAASLAALPLTHTQRLLDELVGANLLTAHGHTPSRYSFHDLLRAYATNLTSHLDTDAQRHAATRRILDHYLHTAHIAGRALNPIRDPITLTAPAPGTQPEAPTNFAQAMAWFTREHPVLLASLDRAVAIGARAHAWQLAWTLSTFLDGQGHWNDWVTTHEAAVTAAENLGDRSAEARMRSILANAYQRLGRLAEAAANLNRTLDLATQAGDQAQQASAHLYLAVVREYQHRIDLALDHARQALTLYRKVGNRGGEARALNSVGWGHGLLGDYDHTLSYCGQALALQQELGNRDGEAATWDSLGYAHRHLGDHQQALTCYQHALDLCRELGERYREGDTLVSVGDTQEAAGNLEAAADAWRHALAIFTDLGHPDTGTVRTKLASLNGTD